MIASVASCSHLSRSIRPTYAHGARVSTPAAVAADNERRKYLLKVARGLMVAIVVPLGRTLLLHEMVAFW